MLDLREGLQTLSARQRDVVILHLYLGYGIGEVAGILGISEGTVRAHLQRGRTALIKHGRVRG